MYIWVFGDMQTVLNLNEIVWKKRCFLTYYKPEIHKHGSMALHSAKRQLFQTISRAPDTNRPREIIRQNYLRRRQPSGTPWETECHKRPLEIRYTKMDDFFASHFGGSRWSCSIWKNRCSFPNPRSSIAKKLNSHHWNSTLKGSESATGLLRTHMAPHRGCPHRAGCNRALAHRAQSPLVLDLNNLNGKSSNINWNIVKC